MYRWVVRRLQHSADDKKSVVNREYMHVSLAKETMKLTGKKRK
jgi:hypothetical protein